MCRLLEAAFAPEENRDFAVCPDNIRFCFCKTKTLLRLNIFSGEMSDISRRFKLYRSVILDLLE